MTDIYFKVTPTDPHAHIFTVQLQFTPHQRAAITLSLPAWIPGSYMIRDFAKNIITLAAQDEQGPLECNKTDKQTWTIAHNNLPIYIEYQVYAWDLSVRSAHLDSTHGFFNGTSLFVEIDGQSDKAITLDLEPPEKDITTNWQVATGLTRDKTTKLCQFGRYHAKNYQQLIDCPVEMANFDLIRFESHGIQHFMAFTGKHFGDLERVTRDVKSLCAHHLKLFGDPPDISEYWFLTYITDGGFGGLEHENSTALICDRFDLPNRNFPDKIDDNYQTFLSLCSHEYFHTWNVKRIKPIEFIPYQLEQESYTEQLWAYEGFTSYYDDFSLLRTGLIKQQDYLTLLEKLLSRYQRSSGRTKQSVAESSFDAWTKFYKQDENAPNAIISYYSKGALIALCIDLKLRAKGKSLDDVMRILWQQHGIPHIGTKQQDFFDIINKVMEQDISDFLQLAIYGTDELPLSTLLADFGVELSYRPGFSPSDLSGKAKVEDHQPASLGMLYKSASLGVTITHVLEHGAAHQAGLSAKDNLLAIDGLKLTDKKLDAILANLKLGDKVSATFFREDVLHQTEITVAAAPKYVAQLTVVNQDLAKKWLNQDLK